MIGFIYFFHMQNEYAPLRVLVIGHAMLIGYRQSKSKIQFKQCTQCEQYSSFMPLDLYWFGVFVFFPDDIRMFNGNIPRWKWLSYTSRKYFNKIRCRQCLICVSLLHILSGIKSSQFILRKQMPIEIFLFLINIVVSIADGGLKIFSYENRSIEWNISHYLETNLLKFVFSLVLYFLDQAEKKWLMQFNANQNAAWYFGKKYVTFWPKWKVLKI